MIIVFLALSSYASAETITERFQAATHGFGNVVVTMQVTGSLSWTTRHSFLVIHDYVLSTLPHGTEHMRE